MNKTEHERKTYLGGVFIGNQGDRLKEFLAQLSQRGVNIYDTTLSRIRMGESSGSVITEQLLLAEVLRTRDPQLKCGLFLKIANTGKETRNYQKSHPQRYLSEGFTENIASDLNTSAVNVRNCIRAMRADLLLFLEKNPAPGFVSHFSEVAERYLKAYSSPPSDQGAKDKKDISDNWRRDSVKDFYERIYAIHGPRTIGTWAPYEAEILSEFYELQRTVGWLTPQDELILKEYKARGQNSGLVVSVKERVSIDFNEDALVAHANALAFGSPVNPLISENIGSSKP